MSEKRILTAKCPSCGTTLQVKTRSVEKTFACPKCQTSVTVSAGPGTAEELPFAAMFDEPEPSLPMAEPLPALPIAEPMALPFAEPLSSSPPCSRRQVAVACGIFGSPTQSATVAVGLEDGNIVIAPLSDKAVPLPKGWTLTAQSPEVVRGDVQLITTAP